MSKTLEETKEHIIELCKQYHLNSKDATTLCKDIETDANGMVNEYEIKAIETAIYQLAKMREHTILQMEKLKEIKRGRN